MRKQPRRALGRHNQWLDREDPTLKRFLAEVATYPVITGQELTDLIRQAKNGDKASRDKVVQSNCRLLVRIAKEFQSINLSINDLIQEGYLGLDESIDKYNPDKNVPFPYFAAWWIKMKIIKFIWWNQTTIRLPESQKVGINKLLKISTRFIAENGRVPSMQELLDTSGLSERMVKNYYNLFNEGNLQGTQSLEELPEETYGKPDSSKSPEDEVNDHIIAEAVSKCLDTLHPAHQEFLRDYYGIGRPALAVSQMARKSGSSTENIRQKRVRLIRYLRENCTAMLAPYADEICNP